MSDTVWEEVGWWCFDLRWSGGQPGLSKGDDGVERDTFAKANTRACGWFGRQITLAHFLKASCLCVYVPCFFFSDGRDDGINNGADIRFVYQTFQKATPCII